MKQRFLQRSCAGAIVLLLLVVAAGCSPDNVTAPDGSTIVIKPESISITDGGSWDTNTQYFTITVYDENEKPMNDMDVTISFIWATPHVHDLVQLYDGDTPVNSPFTATTDDAGKYDLKLVFRAGGVEWDGNLEVRSGTAFASAAIDVKVP